MQPFLRRCSLLKETRDVQIYIHYALRLVDNICKGNVYILVEAGNVVDLLGGEIL